MTTATITRTDPPVRADGRCALETCDRKRDISKSKKKYAGVALDLDPFCSRACCETWHGLETAADHYGLADDADESLSDEDDR